MKIITNATTVERKLAALIMAVAMSATIFAISLILVIGTHHRASAEPNIGDWITASDGTGCRYGTPYISGGGAVASHHFDRDCQAAPDIPES